MTEEFIQSGMEGLDKKLDHIRKGENVVFRVKQLEHFRFFSDHFLREQLQEGKNVIYLRFGREEALAEEQEGLKLHQVDPSKGFELFTLDVHELMEEAGEEAVFLFDCLSELRDVWHSDLMMDNFVRVTCPFVKERKGVAVYPIIRGTHSYDSVSRIRESAQIFLDVFFSGTCYYLTPLKVENRYHGEMFLTHRIDPDESFHPMTYSTSLSRYYAVLDEAGAGEQMQDSWEDFFMKMRLKLAEGSLGREDLDKMCGMMMTRDKKIRGLIRQYFTARDYMTIKGRMVGTGMIGGKACGMLLARKLVREFCPQAREHLEPHDSYYIASDIYYTYIIHNDCWCLWMYQKHHPEERGAADRLREKLLTGVFPGDIRRQFKRMLDYFGTSPFIVRSSSFLEDGFGNAFAGKYESVFCVNSGSLEERMASFQDAVRTVYASTMSPSALEYRKVRGLLNKDEQMALLVQRVSGSRWKQYYFPMAAGVGYSYNSYPWSRDLDPKAGMIRLVVGLGTRAVDRTPGDYPRLVNLDQPKLATYASMSDRHRFSQHRMDILNLETNRLENCPVEDMVPLIPVWQRKYMFSHDWDTENMFRDRGIYRDILFADCGQLVGDREFTGCMQEILMTLQKHYGKAVDIEFTVNISETGEFQINLLQCRPLHTGGNEAVAIPVCEKKDTFFHIVKNVMGASRKQKIDVVVSVDPHAYYQFPYAKKPDIARAIGRINRFFENQGKHMILITPGRIGTSSPELGVPAAYAEISHFSAIMEVAYSRAGYMPELSFGSHMFQDLVEADILYIACMEKGGTIHYNPEFLKDAPQICQDLLSPPVQQVLKVYDVSGMELTLCMDAMSREVICLRGAVQ